MRILCISDIHANLPALEAVFRRIRPLAPDLILSLGDQIGFGPQPREVMELLAARDVLCLLGNHETRQNDYLLRRDPALEEGANFAFVRHTQTLIGSQPLRAPLCHRIENVTFAHAAPDHPSLPLHVRENLPPLLEGLSTPYLVCGHQHDQWSYHRDGRALFVAGSVGMAENDLPGTAQFTLVDIERDSVRITPQLAFYDPAPLRDAFIKNGFAEIGPIMSRLCLEAMTYNAHMLLPFFAHVRALSKAESTPAVSPALWRLAARTFAWRTDGDTDTFWK